MVAITACKLQLRLVRTALPRLRGLLQWTMVALPVARNLNEGVYQCCAGRLVPHFLTAESDDAETGEAPSRWGGEGGGEGGGGGAAVSSHAGFALPVCCPAVRQVAVSRPVCGAVQAVAEQVGAGASVEEALKNTAVSLGGGKKEIRSPPSPPPPGTCLRAPGCPAVSDCSPPCCASCCC